MKLSCSRTSRPQRRSRPALPHSRRLIEQTRSDALHEAKGVASPFRVIALLTEEGRVFEWAEIEAHFSRRAREIGGITLILFAPVKKIAAPLGWSFYDTFRYSAAVVAHT